MKRLIPLALLAATAMGAVGAAIVGWVAIRQRGTYFVMLTLAFAQMFYFLAYSATDITGGDNGLLDVPRPALAVAGQTLWPLATPWQYYGFVAVLFLVVFWLLRRVCDSMFGRTLLAVRDNEERAAAVGYDLRLLKLQAFVISGAVTGLVLGRGHVNDALKYGAQSAVIGAAAGATRGAMSPQQANPVFRQFVQRCASERGLEVIGWQ